jgi:hypothetical protein
LFEKSHVRSNSEPVASVALANEAPLSGDDLDVGNIARFMLADGGLPSGSSVRQGAPADVGLSRDEPRFAELFLESRTCG